MRKSSSWVYCCLDMQFENKIVCFVAAMGSARGMKFHET